MSPSWSPGSGLCVPTNGSCRLFFCRAFNRVRPTPLTAARRFSRSGAAARGLKQTQRASPMAELQPDDRVGTSDLRTTADFRQWAQSRLRLSEQLASELFHAVEHI